MSAIAEQLQHIGESGELDDASRKMDQLLASFEVVSALLERELEQKRAPASPSTPPQ